MAAGRRHGRLARALRRRTRLALACLVAVGWGRLDDCRALADQPSARGVVRPLAQAAISVEIAAPARRIGFREGEAFPKGAPLVEFDCRRQDAELKSARATLAELSLIADSTAYLARNKAAGRQDVEIARARREKAEAEVEALATRIDQCRIVAPFAGRVVELALNAFEIPQAGRPFLRIHEEGRYEVELIVPSAWLRWLKPGAPFRFAIDETGLTVTGRIVRTGAAVDPVSQSIKAFGELAEPSAAVLPGMSGTAELTREAR